MIASTFAYIFFGILILLLLAGLGLVYYGWEYSAPVPPAVPGTIRVACVGDSITFGALVKDRKENCYPAQLEKLLGSRYSVRNFGVNGHAAQKDAFKPYWGHKHFEASSEFEPDIVLLMLGTNDAIQRNWKGISAFSDDYRALLEHYRSLPCSPAVYAMTPPPKFSVQKRVDIGLVPNNERIGEMTDTIKKLARELSIGLIDINAATKTHPECFRFDGIHPDAQGAKIIAEAAYAELRAATA